MKRIFKISIFIFIMIYIVFIVLVNHTAIKNNAKFYIKNINMSRLEYQNHLLELFKIVDIHNEYDCKNKYTDSFTYGIDSDGHVIFYESSGATQELFEYEPVVNKHTFYTITAMPWQRHSDTNYIIYACLNDDYFSDISYIIWKNEYHINIFKTKQSETLVMAEDVEPVPSSCIIGRKTVFLETNISKKTINKMFPDLKIKIKRNTSRTLNFQDLDYLSKKFYHNIF